VDSIVRIVASLTIASERGSAKAVLDLEETPVRRGLVAVVCGCAIAVGCDAPGGGATGGDAGAARRGGERTVGIGVLRVGERVLKRAADGSVRYAEVTLVGGVEVCVALRREAFASFKPFAPLEPEAICAVNTAGETAYLDGVPANSDLIITYTKSGYTPTVTTFRTDEFDVAVPSWADNGAYFVPLVREHAADPWLEPAPVPGDADGLVAIWVTGNGDWGHGEGAAQFAADPDPGASQAEAVVEIEDGAGAFVAEFQMLRDRPRFVPLREGVYALRFSHRTMELVPFGVQEQFMIMGLPTADYRTVEVPVLAGRLTLATIELYCPLPSDGRKFVDLPTCTLGEP
jgi:hypothetical protein